MILMLFQKYRQFILYSIIGASGATLDYLAFLILYNIVHLNPLVATSISTTLGITNNFILNILFNFRVRDKIHHRYIIFYSVGLFGLVLSIGIIYVLHDVMSLNANVAKLVSIPIIVVVQYFLNSRISLAEDIGGVTLAKYRKRHASE